MKMRLLPLNFLVMTHCLLEGLGDPVIHWYAPFFSGGGYCSEAFSFVSIISNFSENVFITQHGDSYNEKFVRNMVKKDSALLQKLYRSRSSEQEISICHSEPGAWHAPTPRYHTFRCPPSNSGYRIGRTMFETDRIPLGWRDRFQDFNEIWVPTSFARDAFLASGVDINKLVIVPEPVDTEFYKPLLSPSEQLNERSLVNALLSEAAGGGDVLGRNTFLFLFVGKWEYRKGVEILLRAFFETFSTTTSGTSHSTWDGFQQDTVLAVVTSAYHSTSDFHNEIRKTLVSLAILPSEDLSTVAEDHPALLLLERVILLTDLPQSSMPMIYRAADVLVMYSYV